MKVAYIAHPISGDIQGNLKRIEKIGRQINLMESDVIPFAHYYFDCNVLDDTVPVERERGIKNDMELLRKGFIDELRLYGDRISLGMAAEIDLAFEIGIPVNPMTNETKLEFEKRWGPGNAQSPVQLTKDSTGAYQLIRDVTTGECPWLDRKWTKGNILYEFTGPTYGCLTRIGGAFCEEKGGSIFFELPLDSVEKYNPEA